MEIHSHEELQKQIKIVIKSYHQGIITYAEYIVRQSQLIGYALMGGVSWEDINKIVA